VEKTLRVYLISALKMEAECYPGLMSNQNLIVLAYMNQLYNYFNMLSFPFVERIRGKCIHIL